MRPDRPPGSTGARAVAALVLTAAVAFALVGTGAYVAAHRIARADALSEALRSAHGVGTAVIQPDLGPILNGDRAAASDLATEVASRHADGTLERVIVWSRTGEVLWSDDRTLIGRSRRTRTWPGCSRTAVTTRTSPR